MKPLTINDINPKSDEFYNFKNFIGIQKPLDKSELEKLQEKIKQRKIMETININIINPKAKNLINDLVEMDWIKINEKSTLSRLLEKTRQFSDEAPSLEEITAEVEIVRQQMYDERQNNHVRP